LAHIASTNPQLTADTFGKRPNNPHSHSFASGGIESLERGAFFQDKVRMGNIDSKIHHFGFYYCPFLAILCTAMRAGCCF
jgi:hypothetical protein